jgi:CxxC motif-containing protein
VLPLLPVASVSTIPKSMVRDAVEVLAGIVLEAPIADGQVVYRDILGTGVDIVSSRRLEAEVPAG